MMARLTLRLPTDLHGRLVAEAQDARLSLNQLIVTALLRAVEPRDRASASERERLVEALGELRAGPELLGSLPRYPDTDLLSHEELQRRWAGRRSSLSEAIIADREDRL